MVNDQSLTLLMFAWKMTRPVNLFALYSGLPLVGLGSFAVQTSIILFRMKRGLGDDFDLPDVGCDFG